MLDGETERPGPIASPTMLRQFAGTALAVFLVVGVYSSFWASRPLMASAAYVAAVGGLIGLLRPSVVRPWFMIALVASRPIGWVVTKIVTSALFFVLFTPVGKVFRVLGRDPLQLRRHSGTAWKDFPRSDNVQAYFRQSQ